MAVTVEKLSGEPIIITTYTDPFDAAVDLPASFAQVAELSKDLPAPVYSVNHIQLSETGFSDITLAMQQAISNMPGSAVDPRIRTLLVGASDLLRLAAESGSQEQYGGVDIRWFPTLDEALAVARAELE